MNTDLMNRLNHLAQDLENPQHIITVLMAVDELERLYKAEAFNCPCRARERELEISWNLLDPDEEERNC